MCLSVHRCICVVKKNQLDVTECFIALMICSTCFGYFYAYHQRLYVFYYCLGCAVLCCWFSEVRCRAAGCASRKRNVARAAAGGRPATSWVHYTTSCNTQSSAPEDGQNNCPKHVELTGIISKSSLLHLVGCLYYLYFFIFFEIS